MKGMQGLFFIPYCLGSFGQIIYYCDCDQGWGLFSEVDVLELCLCWLVFVVGCFGMQFMEVDGIKLLGLSEVVAE